MSAHADDQLAHSFAAAPESEIEYRTVDAVVRDGQLLPLAPLDLPARTKLLLQLDVLDAETSSRTNAQRSRNIAAVVDNGLIRPESDIDLPAETPVRLRVPVRLPLQATARLGVAGAAQQRPAWSAAGFARTARDLLGTRRDLGALGGVMLVYSLVRFVGLAAFPIYFFCDEAIQTNLGLALFQNGLRDESGTFLPPFFRNVEKYNLSLSVYLQGLSAVLFGKSVVVTRATSAAVALLAGVAVALMLRRIFRQRYWWAGALVLSALPVWLLHTRTAFETVMMVSFYACFLCSYLLYRYADPRYLIAAIVFGGATFYSYANGQGVMAASAVLLLLSDLPYHFRTLRARPRLLMASLFSIALVAAQYVRLRILHPNAMAEHLQVMQSVWLQDAPLATKLAAYGRQYLLGLSPIYWFAPDNNVDLDRHLLKGWGNIPWLLSPLIAIGLLVCLRRWRSSAHRVVLIAVLAAPFSAALATIHNYRVLSMVVPAALLATLGIDVVARWLERRVPARGVMLAVAAALVVLNAAELRSALVDGPTAYTNYGLYGMQYGSAQVFPQIADELRAAPDTDVVVSPGWANNPNAFVPFFIPKPLQGRVAFRETKDYLTWKQELKPTTTFVLTAEEYEAARASQKLVLEKPQRVVPYPDGQPGFYFVHMRYVDNIDSILAAEREARRRLVPDTATIDGATVTVNHSQTDLGSVADLFDDDPKTLLRGFEANPFVLELEFAEPRTISGIGLDYWRVALGVTMTAEPADGSPPRTTTATFNETAQYPHAEIALQGGPVVARKLRIELQDLQGRDIAKLHLPGLQLR